MGGSDLDWSFLLPLSTEKAQLLAYHILITSHDVMFVLLCSLIKGAAVQNMAGLIEGDTHEDQIYINHPSNSKTISG